MLENSSTTYRKQQEGVSKVRMSQRFVVRASGVPPSSVIHDLSFKTQSYRAHKCIVLCRGGSRTALRPAPPRGKSFFRSKTETASFLWITRRTLHQRQRIKILPFLCFIRSSPVNCRAGARRSRGSGVPDFSFGTASLLTLPFGWLSR